MIHHGDTETRRTHGEDDRFRFRSVPLRVSVVETAVVPLHPARVYRMTGIMAHRITRTMPSSSSRATPSMNHPL